MSVITARIIPSTGDSYRILTPTGIEVIGTVLGFNGAFVMIHESTSTMPSTQSTIAVPATSTFSPLYLGGGTRKTKRRNRRISRRRR